VGFIRGQVDSPGTGKVKGQTYSARVPDTLDLAQRCSLALNALTGCADPSAEYEIYGMVLTSPRGWTTNDMNYYNPDVESRLPVMVHDFGDDLLQASGVDYRVILISRHEKVGRATSICVIAPLSTNSTCPPTPDQPAFSAHFFQYSLKVDSLNSLVLITGTYNGATPDEFKLAPTGWSAWLRPAAQKVFLEITDDNSTQMSSTDFDKALLALSPENFGTAAHRKYTFHSIIGIGEKPVATAAWLATEAIQNSPCTGNGDTVENPGVVYQELSRFDWRPALSHLPIQRLRHGVRDHRQQRREPRGHRLRVRHSRCSRRPRARSVQGRRLVRRR